MHTYLIISIFSTSLIDRQLLSTLIFTRSKKNLPSPCKHSLLSSREPPLEYSLRRFLSRRKHPNNPGFFPRLLETWSDNRRSNYPEQFTTRREIRSTSSVGTRRKTLPPCLPPGVPPNTSRVLPCIICRTPRFSDCISPGLIPRAGHFGPGTTVSERWRRPPTRSGGANVVWPSPGKKLGNVIYRGAVRGARVAIQIPRHEAGGTRLTGLATPVQWCFVFCILRKKSCFVWFHLVIPFWKWTKRKIEFIEFMYIKWRWDSCYLDSPFRLSLFSRRDIVRTKLLLFKRLIKRSNKVNRAVVRHL